VRPAEGGAQIDPTGKQAGRGAYLCVDPGCWRAAGLRQRLANALKTTISDDDLRGLERYAAELEPIAPAPG
jgi:predicted RNA-binding protein YlxR (DUF448 family)